MRKFYIEYLVAQHGLEKDREGIFTAETAKLAVAQVYQTVQNALEVVCVSDITDPDEENHFGVELEQWV